MIKAVNYVIFGVAFWFLLFAGFVVAAPNADHVGIQLMGYSTIAVAGAAGRLAYLLDKFLSEETQ